MKFLKLQVRLAKKPNKSLKKILIIDSDIDYLHELNSALLNYYEIIKKSKIKNIIKTIQYIKPDLILISYKLNNKSGLDITKLIKKNKRTKNIPIILLTSYHENTELNNLTNEYNIDLCLKKPLNPDVLIKSIENII